MTRRAVAVGPYAAFMPATPPPRFPQRKRLRLPIAYEAGIYFVTICTQDRRLMFGEVVDGEMLPNDSGRMVEATWRGLPEFIPGVSIDAFQLMPNHLHGIVV